MIYYGRTRNGIAMFDTESKVKAYFNGLGGTDLTVIFDPTDLEKAQGEGFGWGIIDLCILEKWNPELYALSNALFDNINTLIDKEPEKYAMQEVSMLGPVSLRRSIPQGEGKVKTNLAFPSDSGPIREVGNIELSKWEEGYMAIEYAKSCNASNIHSVKIKNFGSRYPGIAKLYNDYFLKLCKSTTMSAEEAEAAYNEAINKGNQFKKERA